MTFIVASDRIQEGKLVARESGMGEFGLVVAIGKQFRNGGIYWDNREDAVEDLQKCIDFFKYGQEIAVILTINPKYVREEFEQVIELNGLEHAKSFLKGKYALPK